MREKVRAEAVSLADTLDRSRPLSSDRLEQEARGLLDTMGLDASYLGFAMVMISNEFWRDQLTGVDFSRRLLLLPHCLKHAEGCPADYDEFGLDCRKCGACTIADFKVTAEDLGYKVLVAEGSPIVLKIIVSGYVDAIVGVACLNVLEKALDKVLQVGIPSIAIPLLSSDCKNTSVDDDWVGEVIDLHREPPKIQTRSYVPLLRSAGELFQEEQLDHLAGRPRRQNWMADSSKRAGANGDEVRKEDPAVKISGQKPRVDCWQIPSHQQKQLGLTGWREVENVFVRLLLWRAMMHCKGLRLHYQKVRVEKLNSAIRYVEWPWL